MKRVNAFLIYAILLFSFSAQSAHNKIAVLDFYNFTKKLKKDEVSYIKAKVQNRGPLSLANKQYAKINLQSSR